MRWLGFFPVHNGGHDRKSYGDRCKVQVQVSQCIVFTRGSLQAVRNAKVKAGSCSHWDLLVWRSFKTGSLYVPKEPLAGKCHYSRIMGKGAPEWREGIEDAAKKCRPRAGRERNVPAIFVAKK